MIIKTTKKKKKISGKIIQERFNQTVSLGPYDTLPYIKKKTHIK